MPSAEEIFSTYNARFPHDLMSVETQQELQGSAPDEAVAKARLINKIQKELFAVQSKLGTDPTWSEEFDTAVLDGKKEIVANTKYPSQSGDIAPTQPDSAIPMKTYYASESPAFAIRNPVAELTESIEDSDPFPYEVTVNHTGIFRDSGYCKIAHASNLNEYDIFQYEIIDEETLNLIARTAGPGGTYDFSIGDKIFDYDNSSGANILGFFVMQAPNGDAFKITIDSSGNFVSEPIDLPPLPE